MMVAEWMFGVSSSMVPHRAHDFHVTYSIDPTMTMEVVRAP